MHPIQINDNLNMGSYLQHTPRETIERSRATEIRGENDMTTSRTLLIRRLTLIALFSAILLVTVSPTLQATSRYEIPTTDGTATKDRIALSMSFGSAYSEELSSANLQTSAIAANNAPPKIEKLLVLKAKVSDKEFTTSMAEINVTMSNDVKQYYEEVSYNQTIIVATITPRNYSMHHSEP